MKIPVPDELDGLVVKVRSLPPQDGVGKTNEGKLVVFHPKKRLVFFTQKMDGLYIVENKMPIKIRMIWGGLPLFLETPNNCSNNCSL